MLLILGDLINIVDYDNAGGIIAEVYGSEAVRQWAEFRRQGKFDESRQVLARASEGREDELRALFTQKIDDAHNAICSKLPANVILTYGNVDVPDMIRRYIPAHTRFVDGETVDLDGVRFGFVGGGLPKVGIPGEVAVAEYAAKVAKLGEVDVLCSHIPPAIDDLTYDVVAGFNEPGSQALLDYIRDVQPSRAYFGHVHQPRQHTVTVGATVLINAGYHYRTTGDAIEHR